MSSTTDVARAQKLAAELRCLVCQNQSLADSTAPLALDLRAQIAEQITAGRSDAEIKHYMAERYGEFVLYQPPLNAGNLVLWAAPVVLLLLGAALAWRVVAAFKRRPLTTPDAPTADTLAHTRVQIEHRYLKDSIPPKP